MTKKKLITLFVIHEILMIILGMAIAFRLERTGTDGTLLILPLALLLIALGWIWRGSYDS